MNSFIRRTDFIKNRTQLNYKKTMKISNLIFALIIITILSCKKEKEVNYLIFSGTVENPIIDSFPILDIDNKTIHTIHLDENNSFNDTISASKGYYYLIDRQNLIGLFLSPSMNLNSTISYKENVPSLLFQKSGANENNYLQKKIELIRGLEKVENYKYFLNLNEVDFLKLTDSIKIVKTNFLTSQENLDNDFLLFESFALENEKTSFLQKYQKWRGEFIKDPDFRVSNKYPNPFEKIDVSNEKLLAHPYFLQYLKDFISSKMDDNTTIDKSLNELETIDREIKNQKIKDKLAYENTKFGISQTKKLDEVYKKYMEIVENKVYREDIEETYSNFKKISKGTISPTFELYDINNNLVTLESLRGKLVYIDIWATWCIPCINEIPALKELESEFKNKNIQFVSICLKDSKEQFEKMVKEKKLGGIQLFAPDENITFFKDYFLSGIPRFILIDKNGKIIESNAFYPSNPKLKEQILEYL
ncbi:MAG: TlpA family protein disulfide reductase [Lutibacter sp.]|nr:TlpA family protein disulfide reductase [Lutibacter sp.]